MNEDKDNNWVVGYSATSSNSDNPVSSRNGNRTSNRTSSAGMTKEEKEIIGEMMDLFLDILGKQHGKGPREREAKLKELKEKLCG